MEEDIRILLVDDERLVLRSMQKTLLRAGFDVTTASDTRSGLELFRTAAGEEEPFHLRPATEADLPHIARLYRQGAARSLVSCVRDERLWRYELAGRSEASEDRAALSLIEAADRKRVGFVAHSPRLERNQVGLWIYELEPGVSWLAVTPSVVRSLWALGETWAAQDSQQELQKFAYLLLIEALGRLPMDYFPTILQDVFLNQGLFFLRGLIQPFQCYCFLFST